MLGKAYLTLKERKGESIVKRAAIKTGRPGLSKAAGLSLNCDSGSHPACTASFISLIFPSKFKHFFPPSVSSVWTSLVLLVDGNTWYHNKLGAVERLALVYGPE